MTDSRPRSRNALARVRRLSLVVLVPVVVAACTAAPATKEDYYRFYKDNCTGAVFDRPAYCGR